jgi:hypothetical protein
VSLNIYKYRSQWKLYLIAAGLIIVLISFFYTNYIVNELKVRETSMVSLFQKALENTTAPQSNAEDINEDYSMEMEILTTLIDDVPVIVENETGEFTGYNFGSNNDNQRYLARQIEKIKKTGNFLTGDGYASFIYYKHTRMLTLLTYFPLLQFLLISAFIGFGYVMFSSARKSEQNQVWVGMAKETAHQLGTPISAIMAWIEHLKEMLEEKDESSEIISELSNDVNRLELIADRFSKIGSKPDLTEVNIYEELERCRKYMEKRAPRKVDFEFPRQNGSPLHVNINSHLFDCVIENILRNSLDAMEGKGKITAQISQDEQFVNIDISDTGKGIPTKKFKKVFQPGYTTKSRGWGLGLSLAKRIIENYHSGKIFVKESNVNNGTTFSIKLPQLDSH